MRTQPRHHAFTLVELLTVLAIVGILMGLTVSSISSALQHARRSTATMSVKNIAHSIRAYSLDYGRYPAVAEASGPPENRLIIVGESAALATKGNAALFNTLRAIPTGENTGHVLNPRQQRYYNGAVAKSSRPPRGGFADGASFPSELAGCYLDPWGRQYTVVMDADGDEMLDLGSIYADLAGPSNIVRQNPAVISLAADGIRGTRENAGLSQKPGNSTPPDDIFSWR
jgi:prepilin-type N-terminal cleavage/methylation domain-containing protein